MTQPRREKEESMVADGSVCAVGGCRLPWVMVRVTESGFRVGYCHDHYEQAVRLFGRRRRAAA